MGKGGRWGILLGLLVLVSCGTVPEGAEVRFADAPGAPAPAVATATPEELRLYHMIMDYRASMGLPEIPLSPSLTKVAQIHVRDLEAHFRRDGACNAHSWSENGDWTPCCYTPDHAEAECMWFKPLELTAYTGHGFEIAYYSSAGADPAGALRSWQGSPPHHAVIINAGIWEDHPWGAIGVGIYGAYACVWFGEEPEPPGA